MRTTTRGRLSCCLPYLFRNRFAYLILVPVTTAGALLERGADKLVAEAEHFIDENGNGRV